MKTEWINTNDYYHRIIAAPGMATRERLYRELFIADFNPSTFV
jgi:hypothetical protein